MLQLQISGTIIIGFGIVNAQIPGETKKKKETNPKINHKTKQPHVPPHPSRFAAL